MKKTVLLVLGYQVLTVLTCTAAQLNPLNGNKRLDQVTFATTHNAHSNDADGFKGRPQQKWSIEEQLAHGIRGFMLDLWKHKGKALLCHGGCDKETTKKNRGSSNDDYRPFGHVLEMFQKWLMQNPQEIIVLFIENHVDNTRLGDEIYRIGSLTPLLLTIRDWNPDHHDREWPTIDWMRKNNKRIVIFNEDKSGENRTKPQDPYFYLYDYVMENQWGTTNAKDACKHRSESNKLVSKRLRKLYLFDFFGSPDSMKEASKKAKKANEYSNLKKAIEGCTLKDVPAGKRPNFIALDFVDTRIDDIIRLVNEYNQ